MPRTSKKVEALDMALTIIEKDGVHALTYDSLATATGMSKSGLIYHFPSRHQLLIDCHSLCAERWEEELIALSDGKTAEELSPRQRYRAALESMGKNDPLIELLMSIHAQSHPDFQKVWRDVDQRWIPDPATEDESVVLAMVIANGLWVHDHLTERPLPPQRRRALIDVALGRLAD
ncbi:TetR family transcriptional regulator [Corynebacterium sp. HMSC056E09]|uniref:TetR/AcrR family transcriptional regulator n=1 Tax=Corynebacterium sp. HMSC056E09 TaxID=1739416 RepID=UPI0008A1B2D6|nr:TetR/AcrR family transcriptional regulator [Corynebacterium sp. HMSC056E09]OFQ96217.1 TetR family transcriptional regulator [Corynebacterium sp. HMSC056E09]